MPPEAPVPSPCVGVCRLDAAQRCLGCGRTMDEIAEWPLASSARQREIVAAAQHRAAAQKESGQR